VAPRQTQAARPPGLKAHSQKLRQDTFPTADAEGKDGGGGEEGTTREGTTGNVEADNTRGGDASAAFRSSGRMWRGRKKIDLGPSMWRELCLRSDDRGALDHVHPGVIARAADHAERLQLLPPALPTNAELSTPEYLFTLPTEALRRGVTAPGNGRLARLLAKLDAGKPIKVVSLGGSVTSNAGCWGPLCVSSHTTIAHGEDGDGGYEDEPTGVVAWPFYSFQVVVFSLWSNSNGCRYHAPTNITIASYPKRRSPKP